MELFPFVDCSIKIRPLHNSEAVRGIFAKLRSNINRDQAMSSDKEQ